MGPSARSFASLEKYKAPQVSTKHTNTVRPSERAAVNVLILLIDIIPLKLRSSYLRLSKCAIRAVSVG